MKIHRLGWAALELEHEGTTIVVDLFEEFGALAAFVGEPLEPLPAPSAAPGTVAGALVTHLHGDHADVPALQRALAPGAPVLRPAPAHGELLEVAGVMGAEAAFDGSGLATQIVSPWETVEIGPFRATAVPAVDGFGDPQVSWVVEAGGVRLFHGGDTIFHGSWWLIRLRLGAPDVAFLPVNGARCSFPHRQPASPFVASMDPQQAAVAASLLEAGGWSRSTSTRCTTRPSTGRSTTRAAPSWRRRRAPGLDARLVAPGEVVPLV
jgi:L-ascorbate metabolism protein UlaG (beta-lactamase superfamily)